MSLSVIQKISIYILPLILAITLHEAAHAFMAKKYGDHTAENFGRLSLNPINHIDLLGTIIFPIIGIILGGFIFGWAKPVPINISRIKKPRIGLFWIALAGPLANLAMALIWGIFYKYSFYLNDYFAIPLNLMSQAGIAVNISLMVLNLLPILPLDGGRILYSALPAKLAYKYSKSEPYGLLILIFLLIVGGLQYIIQPIFSLFYNSIFSLLG